MFIPMCDRYNNLIMFETVNEAIASGESNLIGQSCGFEVFELGGGVY